MHRSRIIIGIAIGIAAVLLGPLAAHADDIVCKTAVVARGTRVFLTSADLTARCERGQLVTMTNDGCPSQVQFEKLGVVDTRAASAVAEACAGAGSETGTCVFSATSESLDLVAGGFGGGPLPEPNGPRRTCRNALGRDTAHVGDAVARQLAACNLAVLRGTAGYGPAGDGCDGPAGTQARITNAEDRLAKNVARACGGPDQMAGTADDLDPQTDLGFGGTCPGSPFCEFTIDTLPELIACAQCIAREEAKQVARGLTALPLDAPTTCQLAVGAAAAELADAYLRDVSTCEDRVLAGHTTPPCPDTETSGDLASSAARYDARVAAACGGPVGPTSADITAIADHLIQTVYPTHAEETDHDLRGCKSQIGEVANGSGNYGRGKLRALDGCHVQSLCGQTTGSCPDSEASHAITSRATIMQNHIHSSCDGFTPAMVGFGATCPAVAACGALPTTTIDELIACIQCVSDATADGVIATFGP
ncbi:MAG TPA: hypothetical protein VGK30_07385 [Candidatus Binatia bacterium]|jgi:hypothetical protein